MGGMNEVMTNKCSVLRAILNSKIANKKHKSAEDMAPSRL